MTDLPQSEPNRRRNKIADERADWLLDAIAGATQDRRFLRGDPEYDEVLGGAILLNGSQAIRVAIMHYTEERNLVGQ